MAGVPALVLLGGVAVSACGGSGSSTLPITEALAPINDLASAAAQDAANMETHATAMEAAAAARPDHAHWASDAQIIKASAQSLRLLAQSAESIASDPGSHPNTSVELRRVLGDGLNLQQLGQTLLGHADAMQTHLDTMRGQAASDQQLLAMIDQAGGDLQKMKQDGQAAVDRGKELEQTARRIAENTGQDINRPQ